MEPTTPPTTFAHPSLDLRLLMKLGFGQPLTEQEQETWNAHQEAIEEAERRRSLLGIVDLTVVDDSEPEMLVDGLIVKGLPHLFYGLKEASKTWILLTASAEIVRRGETVVWVDEEMGRTDIKARLRALGVKNDEDLERFVYLEYPALDGGQESRVLWHELMESRRPVLVVFDAYTEVLATAGLNENSGTDVAKWNSWYLPSARRMGSAIAIIDHTGHDEKGRAVASRHKGAAAKVEFLVSKVQAFDRETVGAIELELRKNTNAAPIPGKQQWELGGDGAGGFVCREAGPNGMVPPSDYLMSPGQIPARIIEALKEAGKPVTTTALGNKVKGKKSDILAAAKDLAERPAMTGVKSSFGDRSAVLYEWVGLSGVFAPGGDGGNAAGNGDGP